MVISSTVNSNITKNWETYGNKDAIIYQHLETVDKSQEYLGMMVSSIIIKDKVTSREATYEFIRWFTKCLLKTRIKAELYNNAEINTLKANINKIITSFTSENFDPKEIDLKEYANILFNIGKLYDTLGYGRAERIKIRTGRISDLQVDGESEGILMEDVQEE